MQCPAEKYPVGIFPRGAHALDRVSGKMMRNPIFDLLLKLLKVCGLFLFFPFLFPAQVGIRNITRGSKKKSTTEMYDYIFRVGFSTFIIPFVMFKGCFYFYRGSILVCA